MSRSSRSRKSKLTAAKKARLQAQATHNFSRAFSGGLSESFRGWGGGSRDETQVSEPNE